MNMRSIQSGPQSPLWWRVSAGCRHPGEEQERDRQAVFPAQGWRWPHRFQGL